MIVLINYYFGRQFIILFCAISLHDCSEETAIREIWEETGVRAGNCFEDYMT